LVAWLKDHRSDLKQLITEYGALLIQGFDIRGAEDFQTICRAVTPDLLHYTGGGSPRDLVSGKVYTSTSYSADKHIPLHCEESYFDAPPRYIWFYCEQASTNGGETPIGDMKQVLDLLDPCLVERFEQRGIRYIYNLHDGSGFGRGWKDAFLTEDRRQVESWLQLHQAVYHWREDGSLHMEIDGPAVRTHAETGVKVWGNQAVNWHAGSLPGSMAERMRRVYQSEANYPKHATFSDGSSINDVDIQHIQEVLSSAEIVFPWQHNDILVCDNHRIAHGRRPYTGDRRVLVALA
jgi:alpha-ketoglutarate-dependent taurine dioxygenase